MKSLLFVIVFGIFSILVSEFCSSIEIALEAEYAETIKEFMVIGTPDEAAAQGGPKPDEPSRGKFIWQPGPPLTGGGGPGFAQFVVNLPKAGKYAIWGRVLAWDGNSDSFWVTWNPADPEENPQETQNTQFRWGVAQGSTWHWDRINHWLDGGTFEREWDLPSGKTILTIWVREDATMLDCLYITDNLSAEESEVNPRPPTDDELNLASVKPIDKIPIQWSRIKSNQ